MEPARLTAIRQGLEIACRLVKPRRGALEAFTGGLVKLLVRTRGQPDQAQAFLQVVLQGTSFAPGQEENPESSSPVCYAQAAGLREGFEDAGLPEPPARAQNRQAALRQALHIVRHSVRQLLGVSPPDAALEKQLTALLYQLYELSPEEIAAIEQAEAAR